ncbi:MAG: hypothetical protein NC924_05125 [Candidatus Omnitrophica bacterium]|nr:hypothetical protein [Candidatus Omnitrophota bacterium]
MKKNQGKLICLIAALSCAGALVWLNAWRMAADEYLSRQWDDLLKSDAELVERQPPAASTALEFSLSEEIKKNVAAFSAQNEVRDIFAPVPESVPTVETKLPEIKEVIGTSPAWVLSQIVPKPFPLQYRGSVMLETGRLIAQINSEKRSYLAKHGDQVGDYTVVQVGEDAVHLQRHADTGGMVRLPYRRVHYSTELQAVFVEQKTNQKIIVDKNTTFLGAQIVAIESEAVVFSAQGKTGRLQKGMVWQ